MGDESVLRERAREAMKSGRLPEYPPQRMWGGPGSGAACAVCGKAVGSKEVEFELQFASDPDHGAASYHAHARCFAAWELERRNGGSRGHSLPQGDNGGIIPCREHNAPNQGEPG